MLVVNFAAATRSIVFWKSCWEKLVRTEKESALSPLAAMSYKHQIPRRRGIGRRTDSTCSISEGRSSSCIVTGSAGNFCGNSFHTDHQAAAGCFSSTGLSCQQVISRSMHGEDFANGLQLDCRIAELAAVVLPSCIKCYA